MCPERSFYLASSRSRSLPAILQESIDEVFFPRTAKGLDRVCGYRNHSGSLTFDDPFQSRIWTDPELLSHLRRNRDPRFESIVRIMPGSSPEERHISPRPHKARRKSTASIEGTRDYRDRIPQERAHHASCGIKCGSSGFAPNASPNASADESLESAASAPSRRASRWSQLIAAHAPFLIRKIIIRISSE